MRLKCPNSMWGCRSEG